MYQWQFRGLPVTALNALIRRLMTYDVKYVYSEQIITPVTIVTDHKSHFSPTFP